MKHEKYALGINITLFITIFVVWWDVIFNVCTKCELIRTGQSRAVVTAMLVVLGITASVISLLYKDNGSLETIQPIDL